MSPRRPRRPRRRRLGRWLDAGSFALGVMTEALTHLRAERRARRLRRQAARARPVMPDVVPLSAGEAPRVVPARRRGSRETPTARVRPPRPRPRRRPRGGTTQHSE